MLPKPNTPPVTTSLINDFFLNSSLLYIFEICNSIFGIFKIFKESRIETEVWVNPAAFIIIGLIAWAQNEWLIKNKDWLWLNLLI